ncbi:hypothetical protein BDZ91DRAFT_765074 [Kalaharituber pfeilii]|nr:hypothetical protein BDZ91DRAFT_765074 [Kalaharituber pfeilii]
MAIFVPIEIIVLSGSDKEYKTVHTDDDDLDAPHLKGHTKQRKGHDGEAQPKDILPAQIDDGSTDDGSKVRTKCHGHGGGKKIIMTDDDEEDRNEEEETGRSKLWEGDGVQKQKLGVEKNRYTPKHSLGVIPAPILQWLREFQVKGAKFLDKKFVYQRGGILGVDMGLGKTLQVIAFLNAAFGKTGDERDKKRMRKMRMLGGLNKMNVTPLKVANINRYPEPAFTPTADITKAMNDTNTLCRIGLTGSVLQNKFELLWTFLNWCNPGSVGPANVWNKTISRPVKLGQAHDATNRQLGNARRIAHQLGTNLHAPHVPPKNEVTYCRAASEEVRKCGVLSTGKDACRIIRELFEVVDAKCDCERRRRGVLLLSGDGGWTSLERVDVSMYSECVEVYEALEARNNMDPELCGKWIASALSLPPTQHLLSFIFLISTRAGGMGLNITSANKVVTFNTSWNPSHDLQAQDRSYRICQWRGVAVFRLVSAGTIEEIVTERRYFTSVMGGNGRKDELFGLVNMFTFHGNDDEQVVVDVNEGRGKYECGGGKDGIANSEKGMRSGDEDDDPGKAKQQGATGGTRSNKMGLIQAILSAAWPSKRKSPGGQWKPPMTSRLVRYLWDVNMESATSVMPGSTIEVEGGNEKAMVMLDEVTYRFRPLEDVKRHQFYSMVKIFGFEPVQEFALVAEGREMRDGVEGGEDGKDKGEGMGEKVKGDEVEEGDTKEGEKEDKDVVTIVRENS